VKGNNLILNGCDVLDEGDGAAVSEEKDLSFAATDSEGCEVLLFDLP